MTLQTERLILRPFVETDFEAVQRYASDIENVKYMKWGPNSEEDTKTFIKLTMDRAGATPRMFYDFAVVLKDRGKLIGAGGIYLTEDQKQGFLGWILHKDYWKKGYCAEYARELLRFGFEELKLHRIYATCNAENIGSYRVMEKNGMRREALFLKARFGKVLDKKVWCDELVYAMLSEEWELKKEIDSYVNSSCIFTDFIDVPKLTDGEIELVCARKIPAKPEINHVPDYSFDIVKNGEKIGEISLRIGYTTGLYYGGNIGYAINEQHRGHSYSAKACKLLIPIIKAHKMERIFITNDKDNIPSKRTCEKIGAKLIRIAELPEWHDLYKDGRRFSNIYQWDIR